MKKRIVPALLAVCLLLACLLPGGAAAADDVCFISVNDTLLELSSSAYTAGGVTYVPYTAFNYFQINSTYFSSSTTAMLYTTERQLFLDISQGYSFDAAGTRYEAQALFHNGQVYVPVGFVCSFFGLSWSYISGKGYGDLCRIKDAGVQLTDSKFFAAAASLMQRRYNAYKSALEPQPETPVTPPPADPAESHSDTTVTFSFEGLPDEAVLAALQAWSVKACFFLSAEQLRQAPDTVRRIVAAGHSIGLLCPAGDVAGSYGQASRLLFEAARVRTVLVAAPAGADAAAVRAEADAAGLVFWSCSVDGVLGGEGLSYTGTLLSRLDAARGRADVRLLCNARLGGLLGTVLQHLRDYEFTLHVPSEINAPD